MTEKREDVNRKITLHNDESSTKMNFFQLTPYTLRPRELGEKSQRTCRLKYDEYIHFILQTASLLAAFLHSGH
ncbi:hypothetical protein DUC20_13355 [Salmonella enterica subsp. salamae]|nr:hypothetical protein [Salmonella enterica subsp. salamae]MJZ03696.1 hypothetical protein [Salmonella enterica subsp. salamae]